MRKKVSHVLKKLFFFQNCLNFFQKRSIVGTKQLQIFGKFVFFCFYFFINLDPCTRREWKIFFHKILVSIVGIKRKIFSLNLIKIWSFLMLSKKRPLEQAQKSVPPLHFFMFFFMIFYILKGCIVGTKRRHFFQKKSFKKIKNNV